MNESGFDRLLRHRDVDVVELTADGATDEELVALADALDEWDTEQKAAEFSAQMRRAGLLW